MEHWHFSGRNEALFEELRCIDASLNDILDAIMSKIHRFDRTLLKQWNNEGLRSKIESYGLRYVVPFYELLRYEQKPCVLDSLVIQLLSCVSWRHFDNALDMHEPQQKAHLASLLSSVRLYAYSQPRAGAQILSALERHYSLMTEQTVLERTKPIELRDIWKRCSVFLFAAESVSNLTQDSIDVYKSYINYTGVAHDTHDVFSDIAGGVNSLPVLWIKQGNPDGVLSIETVRVLYDRVRAEVRSLEEMFEVLQVERRFPLIHHLLKESWRTIHDE